MKSFSELTSASQVNNGDLLAISQTSGSGYASKKTTVKDITDKSNLNLAEEYDSTSTYAVDDYVIYESVLYKCIASTTGAFDSTKWTSVVVTDEMGSGGGGGTGGHTIIDENGNSMTARAGLQFVGGANVSDDGTNNKTIVDLASASGIDGVFIDTTNVVKDDFTIDGTAHDWIATEDCIVFGLLQANDQYTSAYFNIDGESAFVTLNTATGETAYIPVKKGQTLTYRSKSGTYTRIKAYGIQTGTTHSKFQPVIYSLEERVIGVWADGKPLYQKVFDLGSDTTISYNSWTLTTISLSGVERLVRIFCGNSAGTAYYGDLLGGNNNGYLQLQTPRNNQNLDARYIIVQYTKSTDTAGSGSWTPQGVPTHHYSTDEQVIGTWFDETLYEKTIDKHTSPVAVNSNTWTTFDTFSTDIKIINAMALSVFNGNIEASYYVNGYYENGEIKILQTRNTSISVGYLTIQYTKSS